MKVRYFVLFCVVNCLAIGFIIKNHFIQTSTRSIQKDRVCRGGPQDHLLFLKTHKTGSSTVQNILKRYAFKNNIMVGMSETNTFNYFYGAKFNREMIRPVPEDKTVKMLMHHMVFDHKEVSAVLPTDSFYFTILRDPATQFESAFQYWSKSIKSFTKTDFKTWINNPEKYFLGPEGGYIWFLAKNGMFFDLGFDNLNESDTYISSSIAKMDKIFHFVMITEYFDISLILLRDLLCWTMDDILSLEMNSRAQSSVNELTFDLKEKIRKWNHADTALYNHYNETLWRRVQEYGIDRLEKELKEFQKRKEELKKFCVEDVKIKNEKIVNKELQMFNPKGATIEQYQLREETKENETCTGLILPPRTWDSKLRKHFYPDFNP